MLNRMLFKVRGFGGRSLFYSIKRTLILPYKAFFWTFCVFSILLFKTLAAKFVLNLLLLLYIVITLSLSLFNIQQPEKETEIAS